MMKREVRGRRVRGRARHDEELAHHARALADVLLHELGAGDADEGAVGVVRHRAREQRLARAGRPVHEHSLRLRDAKALEQLRVLDGQLDHLLDFADRVKPARLLHIAAVGLLALGLEPGGGEWNNEWQLAVVKCFFREYDAVISKRIFASATTMRRVISM